MKKTLGAVVAATLTLMVSVAQAASITGTVTHVNTTNNTIQVEGFTFAMSPTNTVGLKITELKEGDIVTVVFSSKGRSDKRHNAMRVRRAE